MRASRPTTILRRKERLTTFSRNAANADTDLAMSTGLSVSPVRPPMVPRKPEMDLISVIDVCCNCIYVLYVFTTCFLELSKLAVFGGRKKKKTVFFMPFSSFYNEVRV